MARLLEAQLGDPLDPVLIEDDSDYEPTYYASLQNAPRAAWSDRESQTPGPDDLGREEMMEEILEIDIAEVIDLTGDELPPPLAARPAKAVPPREIHSFLLPSGLLVKPGATVELKNTVGQYEVQFLRIKAIVKQGWDSETVIRGLGFTRPRHLNGMLALKLNEVALVAELRSPARAGWEEDALIDVKPNDIKGKRELRMTNAPFPEHRFDRTDVASMGEAWVKKHGPLVCRYRYEVHHHGGCERPFEWALVKISEDEADPRFKIKDSQNLNRWRGGKIPGGSHTPGGLGRPVYDLESQQDSPPPNTLSPGQKYTAGDVFAGAGGASRGIERAGVQLIFSVDHWEHAAASLRSNFPNAHIYDMDVTDFINSKETTCSVDILHLSPPCQFWSPAHTVAGKNDDQNIAVLFSCRELIDKFRPRCFTVEQTFGILSTRFRDEFHMFLSGFTDAGYSVRWKVVPLANYGVPQLRKRLIMIGSCPGEKLPPFPPPTHSKDGAGGLKPWATPKSVLSRLQCQRLHHHRLHNPRRSKRFDPPKPRWDPTKLAKTITTNGGQNYHWDGRRDFTLLEYAVLQGFPTWHRFEGACVKKQIGNAFAPSVVRDGFSPADRPRAVTPASPHGSSPRPVPGGGGGGGGGVTVISLDSDNDDDSNDDDDDDVLVLSASPTPSLSPSSSSSSNRGGGGGRNSSRRLSEVVRRLSRAVEEAEEEAPAAMDVDGLEELSDTETLQDGEEEGAMEVDGDAEVIDLTMYGVEVGSVENPYVLSD
ncbi:S-adenosyl-L-methionine-dependent methyltransferase [Parathielavia hyrcaniae]|uniref:DNA (cytosine-5-)-methyltransferase n=1 Tax=Parathielavia hyrcaniae TaxID=113614 RepID=A0AAN6Q6S9_9PEZI|nr:S-adenosyl-L-methionine-dependent methyltransferase [Parathielavia hyrcaniae]